MYYVSINLCIFIILLRILSYLIFSIYYSNVNEVSCLKDIAICISKKPFELQSEKDFIQKPKHVADLIIF